MKRRVIAVDMDNVICDLGGAWCNVVSECEGEQISSSDVKCWDIHKYFKCGHKVYDYLNYDLFRTLPVIEHSQESIQELMKDFDVFIVTSATNNKDSLVAKMEWLEEHFPFISHRNIVLCGDKSIIKADYLVDDAVHNLEVAGDFKIMFDSHHNKNKNGYRRASDWLEVVDIVQENEKKRKRKLLEELDSLNELARNWTEVGSSIHASLIKRYTK